MFSIGEFARLGQVSVKKLRHFDSIGLLRSARVEPSTGYRRYTAAQLPQVNRIAALRDLGFGLREIAAFADRDIAGPGTTEMTDAYVARERQLRDSIAADQIRLGRLTASRATLVSNAHAEVVIRAMPRQIVATSSGRNFAALERYVAAHGARADGAPMTLIDDDVVGAVPLRYRLPRGAGVATRMLPAVPEMACLVHRGGYAGLPASWQALLAWVGHAGSQPGRALREMYLSFAAEEDLALREDYLTDRPGNFSTELQVPVTR